MGCMGHYPCIGWHSSAQMEPNSSYSHRGTGSSRTQIYRSLASNLLPAPVWEGNGRSSQWSPLCAILPHISCPQISGKYRKRTALSLGTPRTSPHWRTYCPLGSVWKRRPTPGTVWPECWWAPGSASTTWTGTTPPNSPRNRRWGRVLWIRCPTHTPIASGGDCPQGVSAYP